jgi:hypothetical protein
VTTDLGFSGLIRRTVPFSRLLWQARGCGGSILTRILTGPETPRNVITSEQNLLLYCSLFNFRNCFVFPAKKYSWQVCLTIRMVRHNQRIACLTSAILALSNSYENHGFFKYEIQRSHVMAGVGMWEFLPKCYACDIGLHLQPFIGIGIEICHRWDGKHITNEWIRCFTFIYQLEWTPCLTSLKGRCSEWYRSN